MHFHATGTITSPEKLAALAEEERRVLKELQAEGVVTHAFRRGDGSGVFLVVEATDEDEARRQLNRLPFVPAGYLSFGYAEVLAL